MDLLPDTPSVDPPPPLLTDNLSTPLPEKQSECVHQNSFQGGTQYAKLSEGGKAKVENILYLIDKFGVGDEFIHELSMVVDGMPKSYLVKQCRMDLNSVCIIRSTSGKAPGASYLFKELLIQQIKHMVCTKYNFSLHAMAWIKKTFWVCYRSKFT